MINKKVSELIEKSPLPTEQTLKTMEFAKKPVYTIRNNQIIAGILGTAGFILFAFGIEAFISTIPQLSSPLVEIILGLILLSLSGLFLKKLG